MTERQRIKQEAWRIAIDPVVKAFTKIEALKLIAACNGILLPDINENFLTVRQTVAVRRAKQKLVTNALEKKEKRRTANRKAYLKRQLKALEAAELDETMRQNAQPKPVPMNEEMNNGQQNR